MILGVNHITLSVPDLDQAIAFYCGLLGFEQIARMAWDADSKTARVAEQIMGIARTSADAVHLRGPNMVLELFQFKACGAMPQDPQRPLIDHGFTHLCLAVTGLDGEFQRLQAAGMMFIGAPVRVAPGVRSVYGRDPFGNVIELEEAAGRTRASMSALQVVREKVFSLALGVAFLALFLAFFLWQTPSLWHSPLTPAEIEQYAAQLEQHTVLPPAEKAIFISRVREWAAGDDGRAVLLVNLMRNREVLGELPPGTDFAGTPAQANAYYEKRVTPLALKQGEYPLVAGNAQARSLTSSDADQFNQWQRVVVMRAPSRRAFIEFMADPAYGPMIPYKLAAEDVVLIPIDAQVVVPELRWLVGGLLLILYLLICWRRAVRSGRGATAVTVIGGR